MGVDAPLTVLSPKSALVGAVMETNPNFAPMLIAPTSDSAAVVKSTVADVVAVPRASAPAQLDLSLDPESLPVLEASAATASSCVDAQLGEELMAAESFHKFLIDFEFFPTVVQTQSMCEHIRTSERRFGTSGLCYEAFVECLTRIVFIFLSLYGNNVQQTATSKRKCLWFFTMLRVGCAKCGIGQNDGSEKGMVWDSRMTVCMDSLSLHELVLWRALDEMPRPPTGVGTSILQA